MSKKIFVTRPFLPPLDEYITYVKRIWDNQYLTNNGPLVQEFEEKLRDILNVRHAVYVSNGTIAIQLALRALGIEQSVITTPFSFIATASSIVWEKCTPVFADINPATLCIDPDKIEELITPQIQAILGVHIFGIPCDIEKIESIARRHNLKVIYDAAHAFGTKINNQSVFNFGDVSTLSLHAVKLFHTAEGGAVLTNDDEIAGKVRSLKNFGMENGEINHVGINAKNSELHAALGLANIPYIEKLRENRQKLINLYDKIFQDSPLTRPIIQANIEYNYAYYPVIFQSEKELLYVTSSLQKEEIYPRRYFYPSLNTIPYLSSSNCPVSESVSKRILCLPLYHDMQDWIVHKIGSIILQSRLEWTLHKPDIAKFEIYGN